MLGSMLILIHHMLVAGKGIGMLPAHMSGTSRINVPVLYTCTGLDTPIFCCKPLVIYLIYIASELVCNNSYDTKPHESTGGIALVGFPSPSTGVDRGKTFPYKYFTFM